MSLPPHSPNYAFLAAHDERLVVLGTQAERLVLEDPNATDGRERHVRTVNLDDEGVQRVFREAFAELPLLFSACQLGRHEEAMRAFRKGAGLSGVAAFTRDVWDSEAMLFELLLYKGMFDNQWTFANAAAKACEALRLIEIKGERGGAQALVRVF